jgi:tRNA pseudouridine55 synthase
VDKPAGMTSHDVVARVRAILGGRKVGHAGTLDPSATGVLVLCVGKATKISAFLMEGVKEYRGKGKLGVTTDTQDAEGAVVRERAVDVSPADLAEAARKFTGELAQVPPMYSALKVSGQKLYRLARKGVEVERAARPVFIHSLAIGAFEPPVFDFVLRCSKGTYVRTLVHDLGEELGCGAHLAALERTAQGGFDLAQSVPWEVCLGPGAEEAILRAAVPPEEALRFLPLCEAPQQAGAARVGAVVPMTDGSRGVTGLVRIAGAEGRVLGVGKLGEEGLRILHRFPAAGRYGRGLKTA